MYALPPIYTEQWSSSTLDVTSSPWLVASFSEAVTVCLDWNHWTSLLWDMLTRDSPCLWGDLPRDFPSIGRRDCKACKVYSHVLHCVWTEQDKLPYPWTDWLVNLNHYWTVKEAGDGWVINLCVAPFKPSIVILYCWGRSRVETSAEGFCGFNFLGITALKC